MEAREMQSLSKAIALVFRRFGEADLPHVQSNRAEDEPISMHKAIHRCTVLRR